MKVEGATIMSMGELCSRPEAVLESKAIVIDETTTIEPRNHSVGLIRRIGAKAQLLAAAAVAMATAGREAAVASSDYSVLHAQSDIQRRRNAAKAARWISRTGEPQGRSGDKLIRKAMRKQVGRAVLR